MSAVVPFRVHLALITVQCLFASLSIAAKIAMRELSGLAVIAVRVPLGALLLLAIRACYPWHKVDRADLPKLALYALFGVVANQLLFIKGLERTTATNAIVIGSTIPVFTVGISIALGRERPTLAKVLGLASAGAGALCVVGVGRFEGGWDRVVGNMLIVGNSLSFAIYLVISRGLLVKYRPLTVISWTFAFAALGALPFGIVPFANAAPSLSSTTWLALAYIVVFPTAMTYFLNTYALEHAPSSMVAIYIYVQPVIGAFLASAILGERPGPSTFAGAAMIAVGVYVATRPPRAPNSSVTPSSGR